MARILKSQSLQLNLDEIKPLKIEDNQHVITSRRSQMDEITKKYLKTTSTHARF